MTALLDSTPAAEQTTVRLEQRMLMVTPAIAPAPIATAFVLENLLSQFSPDEIVIAAERFPINPADQTTGPNGIRIHWIGRYWTWPQRGRRFVHWTKWLLLPWVIWQIIRLAKRERCRSLFVNFPDEQCLIATYLAASWTGLPLFAFFHNTYLENRHGFAQSVARWVQTRIFRTAKLIFVMSDGMRDELAKLWPDVRFEPLIHTNSQPIPEFAPLHPINPTAIKFGVMGSLNASNYDALGRLCQYVNQTPQAELRIYSNAATWFCQKMGFAGPRISNSTPSDEALLPLLRDCDILLLPHGFTGGLTPIEYATIFPTRTILYLLAGRPIIVHTPPDCFYTNWLRQQDCAEIVDVASVEAIQTAVERLVADPARCEQLVRNALRTVEHFTASRVIGQMKQQVNTVLAAESTS